VVSVYNENEIVSNLQLFDKMYDVVRLVDPLGKQILLYNDGNVSEYSEKCFIYWGKNKICDNCISMRAYNENKSFVKVEYSGNRILTVLAIPVESNKGRVVVELMKDTTDSLIVEHGNDYASSMYQEKIDSINSLAFMDALTEVYNRRYINEKLPVDMLNAALSKHGLSIIMADIDFFKIVNDTYGHLAGDKVLKVFSATLKQCLKREIDWIARFGGEEFLICLPGARVDKAANIAEEMRNAIENTAINYEGIDIRITVSLGVSTINAGETVNLEELIEKADKKLYLAKSNGRNRVEL
jgi:two-component system cell cycle response regulator